MMASSHCLLPNFYKYDDEANLYNVIMESLGVFKELWRLDEHEVGTAAKDIKKELNAREWRKRRFKGVDYDNCAKCCGYLQRYATCHAALVRAVFLNAASPIQEYLFHKRCLRVVAVGGGPGNDLLGFCSAIKRLKKSLKNYNLTVVDLKEGWRTPFEQLMEVGKRSVLANINVYHQFVQADLTRGGVQQMHEADIILIVKVLSNLSGGQQIQVLKNTFSSMKDDALLIYVDTGANIVKKQVALRHQRFKMLWTETRQVFHHAVTKRNSCLRNESICKNMIPSSTYEVCIIQKCKDQTRCESMDWNLKSNSDEQYEYSYHCNPVEEDDNTKENKRNEHAGVGRKSKGRKRKGRSFNSDCGKFGDNNNHKSNSKKKAKNKPLSQSTNNQDGSNGRRKRSACPTSTVCKRTSTINCSNSNVIGTYDGNCNVVSYNGHNGHYNDYEDYYDGYEDYYNDYDYDDYQELDYYSTVSRRSRPSNLRTSSTYCGKSKINIYDGYNYKVGNNVVVDYDDEVDYDDDEVDYDDDVVDYDDDDG